MKIENSTIEDIDSIFDLYEKATDHQKQVKGTVSWPTFERELVETEILENRQFKLLIDSKIACIWAVTFSDPRIWEEKDNDSSIYIHRIATNPDFRGQNFVMKIVEWAKSIADEKRINYIRLDTVGNNEKLIGYYQKCGFDFLGLFKLKNTDSLPAHYHNAYAALFEIELNKNNDKFTTIK
jgi:ribosomal protein S18 acetylase RimI-like enzyme